MPTTTHTTSTATTGELLAILDMSTTIADVLVGLSNAPRCQGIAEEWADNLLKQLFQTQDAMAAALLKRTDENQPRSAALVRRLEWAMQEQESAALLAVVNSAASKLEAGQ